MMIRTVTFQRKKVKLFTPTNNKNPMNIKKIPKHLIIS